MLLSFRLKRIALLYLPAGKLVVRLYIASVREILRAVLENPPCHDDVTADVGFPRNPLQELAAVSPCFRGCGRLCPEMPVVAVAVLEQVPGYDGMIHEILRKSVANAAAVLAKVQNKQLVTGDRLVIELLEGIAAGTDRIVLISVKRPVPGFRRISRSDYTSNYDVGISVTVVVIVIIAVEFPA